MRGSLALTVKTVDFIMPPLCSEPKLTSEGLYFVVGFTVVGVLLLVPFLQRWLLRRSHIIKWKQSTKPVIRWLVYMIEIVLLLPFVVLLFIALGIWLGKNVLLLTVTNCF
ncbi:MAG: hypothetical protein ACD_41C00086G0004 [uncultured bacterium]|nr:MAG: hypothetical protein ACD_41C00086G0004 [uncultured bacterium]HBY73342.1 hypothetical protein [Candidatus Kerfeldbacteria bacterium]